MALANFQATPRFRSEWPISVMVHAGPWTTEAFIQQQCAPPAAPGIGIRPREAGYAPREELLLAWGAHPGKRVAVTDNRETVLGKAPKGETHQRLWRCGAGGNTPPLVDPERASWSRKCPGPRVWLS